ncbi:MAG: protoporphyrinogen oxidase HemJ [Hyphomicrobiales bacterium]|nr:protoporphyrinogen oxidase HemJ [Hyphomicrobiales bacterium]
MYEWVKAFHVIAVIAWMAGMFYLPRLFVYHAEAPVRSEQSEVFKVMERRLMRTIINPAMIATWALGLWLVFGPEGVGLSGNYWLQAKIALVVAMTGVHIMLSRWRKAFERDENTRPARFYRFINEVPPLLTVVIVILVIVKPF